MKKILITAIIAITFLCACSNESEQNLSTPSSLSVPQKKGSTLGDLYRKMTESDSYKKLSDSKDIFFAKMNFTGVVEDIDSETKILTWISDNIASTSFRDTKEAESEWNDLKLQQKAIMVENEEFFTLLYSSGKGTLYPIIHEPYEQTTTGCEEDCNSANAGCEGIADAYFSAGLEYASSYMAGGDFDSAVTVAMVGFTGYVCIMNECGTSHAACLQGCH